MARLDFYVSFKLYIMLKLSEDQVLMGRGQDCDIVLCDNRVSRTHALIRKTGEGHQLEDRSTNGTRVNDALVTGEKQLVPGDRIYIEDYILIYQGDDAKPVDLAETRTVVE